VPDLRHQDAPGRQLLRLRRLRLHQRLQLRPTGIALDGMLALPQYEGTGEAGRRTAFVTREDVAKAERPTAYAAGPWYLPATNGQRGL
jgi:hypothetical protein